MADIFQAASLLKELGIKDGAIALENLVADGTNLNEFGISDIIVSVCQAEMNARDMRRQEQYIRQSGIPHPYSASDISYSHDRGAAFREQMSRVLTLDFIRNRRILTIFGASGAGKSFLMNMLLTRACSRGYRARYFTTGDLLAFLRSGKKDNGINTRRNYLKKYPVIGVDDFCLLPYTAEDQALLFEVFNDRYETASTIIASQKTPDKWLVELGQNALAESLTERMATNNYTIVLQGGSRRKSCDMEE